MPYQDPHKLSEKERAVSPYHHIDPGFINERLCFSTFGIKFHKLYEERRKPGNDHMEVLYNHHLLVDMVLILCRNYETPTLVEVVQNPVPGKCFCSTEKSMGVGGSVYGKGKRVQSRIRLPFRCTKKVVLSFGTEHFVADTGKMEMSDEHVVSIVGVIREVKKDEIVVYPLIIGAPSFDHPKNQDLGVDPMQLLWGGWDLYQLVPEDIEEFSKLTDIKMSNQKEWLAVMKDLSEDDVKSKICNILGDSSKKDWGGENNDHFTTKISIDGKRKSVAFIFKGPAKFSPMKITHLGKNGDQLIRLSHTPAEVLIVQHCHEISEPVREMLRAIAVQPSNPRHYCFIDGSDTYRILRAYRQI